MTGPRIGSIIRYKSWMAETHFFVISSKLSDVDDGSYTVRLWDIRRNEETALDAAPVPYSDTPRKERNFHNTLAWDYVE